MARVPDSTTVRRVTAPPTTRYPYVSENMERIIVANSVREPAVPESVRWPYPEGCIVWKGDWEILEDGYQKYDAVYHEGSSYVSNVGENTDEPPSSTWDLLALHGAVGSTGGTIFINFAYGDATPADVYTTSVNALVGRIELYINEAFDGVGASLSVGDGTDNERLMSTAENDPTVIGSFYSHPGHLYVNSEEIKLFINQGAGANSGSGMLVLEVIEE